MTTPIEDRIAALELWKSGTVEPALSQLQTALTNQAKRITALETALTAAGPRLTVLETNYTDAVKRFQKAERLVARLRVILRIIWKSTSGVRDEYLSRLPEDERSQSALDLEAVDNLENIGRREDPDEWREPVNGA